MQRPDLVHIVTEGPLGWSALQVALKLRLPVCSDFHTNFHAYSRHYGIGWLKTPIAAYLRKFHNRTRCTMVPTDGDARRACRRWAFATCGWSPAAWIPAFSIRRGAARSCASAGERDRTTPSSLYVGRLAPEKNLPALIAAFDAIRVRTPRARLVLVGDGPESATFAARHPDFIFAGLRVGEDLAAHYASGDIFLFPSLTETYGNVTIEAMASGLAVVAYDYAAAAEHIEHARSGLLAEYDDVEELVRCAAELAEDPERIKRYGARARATALKLDWDRVVGELEAVFLTVAEAAAAERDPA